VDGDCDTAIVVINVTPVDDLPVAVNDTTTTSEDTPVSINVCSNDTASGDGGNTTTVATAPLHGTVTLDSFCHFTYTPDRILMAPTPSATSSVMWMGTVIRQLS
jgi:hypothetical protein